MQRSKPADVVKSGMGYSWQLRMSEGLLKKIDEAARIKGLTFDVFVYCAINTLVNKTIHANEKALNSGTKPDTQETAPSP